MARDPQRWESSCRTECRSQGWTRPVACHVSRVFAVPSRVPVKPRGLSRFFVSVVMDDETVIDSASHTDSVVQASRNKHHHHGHQHKALRPSDDQQCRTPAERVPITVSLSFCVPHPVSSTPFSQTTRALLHTRFTDVDPYRTFFGLQKWPCFDQ